MAKEQVHRGKFRGKANASLREPCPWGVTHAGLNSSGNERPVHTRGGVVYQGSSSETQLIRDRFLLGLVMQAPSVWLVPKFQTPGRKAGVQHKTLCLPKQFRHSKLLLPAREVGALLKPTIPDAPQGPTQQGQRSQPATQTPVYTTCISSQGVLRHIQV